MDLYETSVAQEYADFAAHWAAGVSPVFEEWAHGVAGDAEVLALLEQLPRVKRQPNLVFAAARWHGARPGPYADLRRVLLTEWETVRATVLARSTQTNEVGRCATLLPALGLLPGPLALVEVGPSAGLCLYPDRWSYRWSDGSRLDPRGGPGAVVLDCTVSGPAPLPSRLPEIAWRAGIDLNPLDVRDEDAMAWLRQLVWPGQEEERLPRLAAAVAVAREDPPYLVKGDLLTGLPGLLAQVPSGATVVVQHSAVVAYLEAADRRRFDAMMRGLVADGVRWVSNEAPGVLPSVTGDLAVPEGAFVLGLDGDAVGLTHPHGRWIRWR